MQTHLPTNSVTHYVSHLLLRTCRVIQNLQYIHEENPVTHVLVLSLLPRGFWHNPKAMFKLPSAFSRAITAVNHALERYAFGTEHMHYADCRRPFVQTGNVSILSEPPLLYLMSIDCRVYGLILNSKAAFFCLPQMQADDKCIIFGVLGAWLRFVHAAADKRSQCHSRMSQDEVDT